MMSDDCAMSALNSASARAFADVAHHPDLHVAPVDLHAAVGDLGVEHASVLASVLARSGDRFGYGLLDRFGRRVRLGTDISDRHAEKLDSRPPVELLRCRVHVDDAQRFGVDHHHGVFGRVEQEAVVLFALAHCELGGSLVGHVAGNHDEAVDRRVVDHAVRGELRDEVVAIGACDPQVLDRQHAWCRSVGAPERRDGVIPVVGMHQLDGVGADEVARLAPQAPADRRRDVGQRRVHVHHDDHVGHVVDQEPQEARIGRESLGVFGRTLHGRGLPQVLPDVSAADGANLRPGPADAPGRDNVTPVPMRNGLSPLRQQDVPRGRGRSALPPRPCAGSAVALPRRLPQVRPPDDGRGLAVRKPEDLGRGARA